MSVKSILDAELGLHEHPAQLTPRYLEELLDELDIRMAVRVVDPPEPGIPVGRFEAVMHLGSGGYGCVVEAWDPDLERAVALKLCVNDKPAAAELLQAEAKTLARLQHPNIITAYETGHYHESLFLVMEFASGGSLSRRALEAERMPWRRLVPIFANVARGLAAAHDAGVTHGDLKPSNILLHGDGRPCIADFGLARIIGAAPLLPHAIGTLLYAAPEVLDGGEPDPRSDQWSLFVTLWECLDRRLPFISNKELRRVLLGLTEPGMLWLIKRWPGPSTLRSDVPASLREILEVGLSLDPRERFSSMHAVAEVLDQVIAYDRLLAFGEADPVEEPEPAAEELADAASDLRLVNDGHGEEGDTQLDVPPRGDAVLDPGEVEIVPEPRAGVDASSSARPWVSVLIGGLLFGAGVFSTLSFSHLSQPLASATTEQARDEQRAADDADESLPAKGTPNSVDDVPLKPDASVGPEPSVSATTEPTRDDQAEESLSRGTPGVVEDVPPANTSVGPESSVSTTTEPPRDDQHPADGADESLPTKGTPCVVGDVPIEPDASVQAVCRMLETDGHEVADTLWAEIADSREGKARKSRHWFKLACDTTVLAQTFLHEAATSADPEQAKLLRKRGERLARHAEFYLGEATAKETARAVSQVRSIVAGITETSTN